MGAETAQQGTGAATLAAMTLDAAERYDGAALKYRDGDETQIQGPQPELSSVHERHLRLRVPPVTHTDTRKS